MSEPAWTPGPWHVEPVTGEDDQQFYSDDFNGKVFCVCHPRTECDATTVVPWLPEGDANLIAAAPRMYAALEALHERYIIMVAAEGPEATEARYALARARGESPPSSRKEGGRDEG